MRFYYDATKLLLARLAHSTWLAGPLASWESLTIHTQEFCGIPTNLENSTEFLLIPYDSP